MVISKLQARVLWWHIFVSLSVPLFYIVAMAFANQLGAEPAKAMVDFLGQTALIVLILTLCVSPLKKIPGLPSLLRYRRMIGLWCFFYAFCHVLSYGLFLVDWTNFVEDLYKRPYVTMGAIAFIILFVLAITSPKNMVRKLGKKWKSVHQWIYVAIIAAMVHLIWQVRSDYSEAILYSVVVIFLLSLRIPALKKS